MLFIGLTYAGLCVIQKAFGWAFSKCSAPYADSRSGYSSGNGSVIYRNTGNNTYWRGNRNLEGMKKLNQTSSSHRELLWSTIIKMPISNMRILNYRRKWYNEELNTCWIYHQCHKIDLKQLTNQFIELQVRGEGELTGSGNIADRELNRNLKISQGIAGVQVYGRSENSIEVRLHKRSM